MIPALLIRKSIDWVRHNKQFENSNPYSRCEEVVKTCQKLWDELIGISDNSLIELAAITAYWLEFFHTEDPSNDEMQWSDGLKKRASQYDSFEDWQKWFVQSYAKVYKENNIWSGILMTSWAYTHQYELVYTNESWTFSESQSYLPTSEMWRLEPHINLVKDLIKKIWLAEIDLYESQGFIIEEISNLYLGKIEGLGFDNKTIFLSYPPGSNRPKQEIELAKIIADLISPIADDGYRRLDNIIFADDHLDLTSFLAKAKYVLESNRRYHELLFESNEEKALMQLSVEGWLVNEELLTKLK